MGGDASGQESDWPQCDGRLVVSDTSLGGCLSGPWHSVRTLKPAGGRGEGKGQPGTRSWWSLPWLTGGKSPCCRWLTFSSPEPCPFPSGWAGLQEEAGMRFPISLRSVPPPHLTYSPNWQSRVPTPGEMLSPLLCTYPCCVGIADVCRCVRVCCRTGFAVPFSQAGVCCSAVVLFRVTDLGGGRGETLSNGGGGGGGG